MDVVPSPSQGAVIAVSDLRKSYGPLRAVDGVSFTVERGEIFGLLGPNGAGKTTTVEILEGLRRPDGGQASVLGIDVVRDPGTLKERIGVQLQTAALYPELTVRELITLFGSFYRRSLPASRLIEQLGLEERAGAVSRELSGGQRQRLTIALALVNDPELIFLDEPTTGLDPRSKRDVQAFVREVQRDHGATIFLTTHDMDEAEALCDRIAFLVGGRIVAEGTPLELRRQVAGGRPVESIDMEDVFMELTGRSVEDDEEEATDDA